MSREAQKILLHILTPVLLQRMELACRADPPAQLRLYRCVSPLVPLKELAQRVQHSIAQHPTKLNLDFRLSLSKVRTGREREEKTGLEAAWLRSELTQFRQPYHRVLAADTLL